MFLSQAELGKNNWWRYLLTVVIVIGAFILGHTPLFLVVEHFTSAANLTEAQIESFMALGNFKDIGVGANLSLFVILIPFSIALAAMLACIHLIHKRPTLSVITSRGRLDIGRILWGAGSWIIFAGIIAALVLPKDQIVYQFDFATFVPMAMIALLLIPLQVAAEEVLLRGYILQALARFIKQPLVLLAITTILFLLPHLSNPEFLHGFTKVAPFYAILGAMFGALAILDEGLELPIGVHLGNNLFAAILLSTHDGALNTPSIFQIGVSQVVDALPWFIIAIIATLATLQWKYRFDWSKFLRAR